MSKNNIWKITPEQIEILSNCQKINEIILIEASTGTIVSVDALDSGFTMIYVNENFNYSIDKEIIAHNLNEILKATKNIENPNIVLTDSRISVTDSKGTIKCNFLYTAENLVSEMRDVINSYDSVITGIKDPDNGNIYTFEFTLNEFNSIRKFTSAGHNTLSFLNGKIVIYDNLASSDVNVKDNVEINIPVDETVSDDFRIDINLELFKKMQDGKYTCTLTDAGFALFEQVDGSNIYGIVSNIL